MQDHDVDKKAQNGDQYPFGKPKRFCMGGDFAPLEARLITLALLDEPIFFIPPLEPEAKPPTTHSKGKGSSKKEQGK